MHFLVMSLIETQYIDFTLSNNHKYILILKDLEDKDIYPVYFENELEINKFKNNIISETKVKVIKEIKVKIDWKDFIASEMKKDYFINLSKSLKEESKLYEIYPPKEDIF